MATPPESRPDICVIGTDPVGIEIAFAAAGLGVPVAMVTQVGATDPHALLRLRALGCTVIEGAGSFRDKNLFAVQDSRIRARRFVLATGTRPKVPAVAGVALPPVWDARTKACQKNGRKDGAEHHVLVFGGGPSGLQHAIAASLSGCRVTVLAEHAMLDDFDSEAVDVLRPEIGRRGIALREHVRFADAAIGPDESGSFTAMFSNGPGPISFTHAVFDCGRTPFFDGLGLEKAGLQLVDGELPLSASLRSGNRRIYVVGDAAGAVKGRYPARTQSGAILSEILFRRSAALDPALMSRMVLTHPAIAEAGLLEREIRPGQASRFRFYRTSLAETSVDEGLEKGPAGQIKVITSSNGLIRGVSILAEDAAELIVPFTLAMAKGIPLHALAQLPIATPSHAEAIGALARQSMVPRLRTPGSRGLMRLLRIFG